MGEHSHRRVPPPTEKPACPDCGWPDDGGDVVSRHRTSEGTVVWTRCFCGAVRAWLDRNRPAAPIARAGPADDWG